MKIAICLVSVLLICIPNVHLSHLSGGPALLPYQLLQALYGYRFPSYEETAASLGGAPVGVYSKSSAESGGFPGLFGGVRSKEVSAVSLEKAPVAAYGKDHY